MPPHHTLRLGRNCQNVIPSSTIQESSPGAAWRFVASGSRNRAELITLLTLKRSPYAKRSAVDGPRSCSRAGGICSRRRGRHMSLSWLPPIHGPIAWTGISSSNGYRRTATAPPGRNISAGLWMGWQFDQRMPAPRLRAE